MKAIATIFFSLLGASCLFGQLPYAEPGAPLVQIFGPEEYNASPENFEMLQAPSGFLYVGNHDGVLEFDGTSWRTILIDDKNPAYSLALDEEGTIFVGGQTEIGYLEADSLGQLQYKSLIPEVPKEYREFGGAYKNFSTAEGVFFLSSHALFRWKDGHMHILGKRAQSRFFGGYCVNDEIYVLSINEGIVKVEGDSLMLVLDVDGYRNQVVNNILPISHDGTEGFLLLTLEGNFFFFDATWKPASFSSDPFIEPFLQQHSADYMMSLRDHNILILTFSGAILLMDDQGRLERMWSKDEGLLEAHAKFAILDRQKGLWITTDHGLQRIEMYAPYSFWGETKGLAGGVRQVLHTHDRLYVGNRLGFHRQQFVPVSQGTSSFNKLEGIPNVFAKMALPADSLFVGTYYSLNKISYSGKVGDGLQLPIEDLLALEKTNRHLLLLGFSNGIGVIEKLHEEDSWNFVAHFPEFTTGVHSFAEDPSGALWVGSAYDGIRKFLISDFEVMLDTSGKEIFTYLSDLKPEILFYGEEKGVPKGAILPFFHNDSLWIATTKGLLSYQEGSDQFVPSLRFGVDSSFHVWDVAQSENGDLWMLLEKENKKEIGKWEKEGTDSWRHDILPRIAKTDPPTYLYPDPNEAGILWIGGGKGLYRYDEKVNTSEQIAFSAYIREVRASDNAYSPLESHELPYASNALFFRFAAPAFTEPAMTEYQYLLEGFDSDWSAWSTRTDKEYNNLLEANYRFRVRARDIEGNISQEGVFIFEILPPWYRTMWARSVFSLLGIMLILLLVSFYNRWRLRQLQERNQELEQTVEERTEEIRVKNEELQVTLETLKTTQEQLIMQEKMASLGQMTAGIAHEIKNPLNFIYNFAEGANEIFDEFKEDLLAYQQSGSQEDYEALAETIHLLKENNQDILNNGKRANEVVNSMMNHANDNKGEKRITDLNQLLVEQLDLALAAYQTPGKTLEAQIIKDLSPNLPQISIFPQEFGRVMLNLIRNAFDAMAEKQTQSDSSYQPELQLRSFLENGQVVISMKDNGTGIPDSHLDKIFQPFFTTRPAGQGNTGLGLSISYDIITKGHQGSIEIQSEEGEFTEFIIRLPIK